LDKNLEAWFELLHHQLLSVQPASKAMILLRKLKMREFLQVLAGDEL